MKGNPEAILDLARRYWDAEMRNDIEGIMACYAPDAVLMLPNGRTCTTPAAIRAFYERAAQTHPKRSVRIVDYVLSPEGRGALAWEAVLEDREGRRSDLAGINLVTVQDGRFWRLHAAYPEPRLQTGGHSHAEDQ